MRCSIHRTETQVRRQHLPDDFRLEPYIRLRAAHLEIAPVRLNLERLERLVKRQKNLVGKSRPDLAYCLEVLRIRVVACEQKRAVYVRALSFAVICADDDQVERVAHAAQVVLFELQLANDPSI